MGRPAVVVVVLVVAVVVSLNGAGCGDGAAAAHQLLLQLLGGGLEGLPPADGPDPEAAGKSGRAHVGHDHV